MAISRPVALVVIVTASAAAAAEWPAPSSPVASSGYVGSTPCGPLVRAFLDIPGTTPCERITWALRLRPGAFELDATYGMQAVNEPGFATGARVARVRGTWSSGGRIASYANSETHMLNAAGRTLRLALLDGVLMHPIDARGQLLRGDAGWSYTLTREDAPPRPARRHLTTFSGGLADWAGDFEGRTACVDVMRVLQLTPSADCRKLKWGLTLLRDGTYRLDGTLYRAAPRTGSWALRSAADTGAVIYVLDSDGPSGALSLLRAGSDVLLFLDASGAVLRGNGAHSYTLNRSVTQ